MRGFQGKKNIYVCQNCKRPFATVDRDDGTTPFITSCKATPGCRGLAKSSFYRVDQNTPVTFEWYRPGAAELAKMKNPATLHHVTQGGLLLRPIVANDNLQQLN